MSVTRPRTGHETTGPGEFRFTTIRVPPDPVLPPTIRKLTAELRDHHQKWNDAKTRHVELTSDESRRAARRKDAEALGKAVRADKALPDNDHVKQLDADIEATEQTMAQHEAAGRLIADELDGNLRDAATEEAAACRERIAAARDDHTAALEALEAARQSLITNTAGYAYWRRLADDGNARWQGRTDGGGASIVAANGQHIPLEPFGQLVGALRGEADRLARIVPDEPAGDTAA